jgi:hypothetical protein
MPVGCRADNRSSLDLIGRPLRRKAGHAFSVQKLRDSRRLLSEYVEPTIVVEGGLGLDKFPPLLGLAVKEHLQTTFSTCVVEGVSGAELFDAVTPLCGHLAKNTERPKSRHVSSRQGCLTDSRLGWVG